MNATSAAILGLLSRIGPVNANTLSRNADVVIGDYWTLSRSQVYRELETLERGGLVLAGPKESRSSRAFSVTRRGLDALDEWLMAGPAGDVIRMPVLLSIRFGARMPPERLREIIDEFSRQHEVTRARYSAIEEELRHTSDDHFAIATIRFGQAFEAAVTSWLDDLPALLPAVYGEVVLERGFGDPDPTKNEHP